MPSRMSEWTVVILAGGGGSRLHPLAEETPKSLLPVGNRPLISFQLELLERIGFTEAIVITTAEASSQLKKYVSEVFKGKIEVTFELLKERVGTAEALLKVKDRIKTDFIVISGDLIADESFFFSMADIHRTRDAALTVLLKKEPPPADDQQQKKKKEADNLSDFIGLNDSGRLLYWSPAADVEENLTIKKSILKSNPDFTMYTALLDAHFYMFGRWVLDLLAKQQLSSIKAELVPLLIKLQFKKDLKKYGVPEEIIRGDPLLRDMSSAPTKLQKNKLGCFAFVTSSLVERVNTLPRYTNVNRMISANQLPYVPAEPVVKNYFIHQSAVVKPQTQIGAECIVGEGSLIGDKCGIKKSNIGKHCNIHDQVKITNSIIMDHVTILHGCNITNSIICNSVHIAENCNISNSQVGVSYNLQPNSTVKNECLVEGEVYI